MLRGRRGHARLVVLTVVDEELAAVLEEFGAGVQIRGSGCWTCADSEDETYPLIIAQSRDRSNMPSLGTVNALIEDWRPECVILVGIAGGIVRAKGDGLTGPSPGDVVLVEYVHYGDYAKSVDGRRFLRYFPLAHPSTHLVHNLIKPIRHRDDWDRDLPAPRPDGEAVRPAVLSGEIVSLDFLAGDGRSENQREIFSQYDHALAVDMESAGVARAIHEAGTSVHYHPAWVGIRGISDRAAADQAAQDRLGDNDSEREQWRDYAAATAARMARLAAQQILFDPRPPSEPDAGASAWTGPHG